MYLYAHNMSMYLYAIVFANIYRIYFYIFVYIHKNIEICTVGIEGLANIYLYDA